MVTSTQTNRTRTGSSRVRKKKAPLQQVPDYARVTLTAGTAQLPRASSKTKIGGMSSASGLNAVLETAALMHASGQPEAAKTVIESAIGTEPETASMPLVWLALLDLYQQLNDQASFERYGMEYAVRFEQSPPVWSARGAEMASPFKGEMRSTLVLLAGEIAANNPNLTAPLLKALDTPDCDLYRLHLARAELVDEEGALHLANKLCKVRQQQLNMVLEPWPEALLVALKTRALTPKEGPGKNSGAVKGDGRGYWLLWLELLQWHHDEAMFEACALDFALRFEVSPPAWAPAHGRRLAVSATERDAEAATETPVAPNVVVWRGVLQGAHTPQLAALKERLPLYDDLTVDLREVTRIDFSYGGALANLVIRAEGAKKRIRFIRTSPMVLSLLLLVGIPARAFSRR